MKKDENTEVEVVETAKRRRDSAKETKTPEESTGMPEIEQDSADSEQAAEEAETELKAMDAAEAEKADGVPEDDSGEEKAAEEAIKDKAETGSSLDTESERVSEEAEAEMYGYGGTATGTVEKEPDLPGAADTAGKRTSIRQEKEKVLDQLSKAGNTQTGGTPQQIRGITQASRDEKREIYSDGGIIPLGDELQFKSEGQKRHEEYITLVGSKRSHSCLTGTVHSISTHAGRICAVVRYGNFTVLIPSEKFLSDREEKAIAGQTDEGEKLRMRRRYATQRIGSQVDFVVTAIDEIEMLATGDRHEAMEIKKQAWYLSHRQNSTRPVLEKGTRAEARVVMATRNMLFVEVFGIEFVLREHDIAYVQIPNVSAEYPVGSTVPVIFTKLERERTDSGMSIRAQVSVKEAVSDPRKKEFDLVNLKDVVSATVTGVNENGIIVRLGGMTGKQDAMCQFQKKTKANGFSSEYEVPEIGKNVIVKIRKKEEFDSRQNPIYRVYGDIVRVL